MKQVSYCLFDTSLGKCGIAWSQSREDGGSCAVTLFQLPEATADLTESRIAHRIGASSPSIPPPQIAEVISKVCKHLHGEPQDLRNINVDLEGAGAFVQRVCEAAREIPLGQTITYAELANNLGLPSGARAVGGALGRNPVPVIIPCHRVLAAAGKPGGFSAYGGRVTKAKLLATEGAVVNLCLDFSATEETTN